MKRRIRNVAPLSMALLLLLALPSCGLVSALEKTSQFLEENRQSGAKAVSSAAEVTATVADMAGKLAANYDQLYGYVTEKVANVESKLEEIDTDQDGKLSMTELLVWLLTAGGGGSALLAIRNSKSNERKAKAEQRIAALEVATTGRANIPSTPVATTVGR